MDSSDYSSVSVKDSVDDTKSVIDGEMKGIMLSNRPVDITSPKDSDRLSIDPIKPFINSDMGDQEL